MFRVSTSPPPSVSLFYMTLMTTNLFTDNLNLFDLNLYNEDQKNLLPKQGELVKCSQTEIFQTLPLKTKLKDSEKLGS